jgi:transposase-like protein
MPTLTPSAWAQIRADYERTDRPIDDICAEHGISSGTLRDRVRRWNWTRRRQPIPFDGPPPLPFAPPLLPAPRVEWAAQPRAALPAAPDATALPADTTPAPPDIAAAPSAPVDVSPALIAQRLQGAVARVLPAIETTLGRIAGGPTSPRELENAARALGALTRTLRELNAVLAQHVVPEDREYENLDDFRARLAAKIDAIVAERPQNGSEDA